MGDQDGSWPKQVASIAHGRCAPSKKPRVDGELLFIGLTSTAVPAREAIEELEAQKTEHEKITTLKLGLSCYDVVRGLASLLGGEALAASARVALKAAVGGFSEKSAARLPPSPGCLKLNSDVLNKSPSSFITFVYCFLLISFLFNIPHRIVAVAQGVKNGASSVGKPPLMHAPSATRQGSPKQSSPARIPNKAVVNCSRGSSYRSCLPSTRNESTENRGSSYNRNRGRRG
ncbi:hypothetical protein ACOSQ3_015026 [Xanthoceras sorbifolium]